MKPGDGRAGTLEETLGHIFARPDLLRQALCHASTATGRGRRIDSNERLEFLGDRVLGLCVAHLLFERFPDEDEGELARRFAVLVGRDALAQVAAEIGLAAHLIMSNGEAEAGGRDNPALLADACEAVIAGLYLDGGLDVATAFVERYWSALVEADREPPKDAKTALQEWAQGRGLALPAYDEIERLGPPHAPRFHVQVSLDGRPPERGSGSSKRAAERAAAQAMVDRICGDAG